MRRRPSAATLRRGPAFTIGTMPFSRVSRFGIVNSYLVEEEDGLTVIDTMITGATKGILAGAEAHGMPIVRILLTHAHQDHVSLRGLPSRKGCPMPS